ncbi:hypothetical protein NESM_000446200 [Novymonas esmeraldas]|uniref:Uncharacterized protein n=1 Tax=Novymonas esmeraldas TaxID=1808958 RepID=A0AAW0ENH2_9TRYP
MAGVLNRCRVVFAAPGLLRLWCPHRDRRMRRGVWPTPLRSAAVPVRRCSSADGPSNAAPCASTDDTAAPSAPLPQAEPSSAKDRATGERRRRLFAKCGELNETVQAELRAEVARDVQDGVAAVPPLAPRGWRVLHTTGSSYITMSRLIKGGYVDSRAGGRGRGAPSTTTSADDTPRYRSVHDLVTGARPQHGPVPPPSPPHVEGSDDAAAAERRETWVLHRGRYTAAHPGSSSSGGGGGGVSHGAAVRYARSDTHVTVFAPFRSIDLATYDPRVDICEWTRFDVLVRKERPAEAAGDASAHTPTTPLEGQQAVWDEGRCMFARLACVNSELRVRSLFFVSHRLARALEEHAVFGKGEPLYLELLRRLRIDGARHASGSPTTVSAASPVNVFDAPAPTPATPAAATSRPGASSHSSSMLTSQFGLGGDYARSFAYGGPHLTELSKELREALSEYIMMDLGITSEVAEYVCQLQYFLEQEEYLGWLAQWGHLASTLRQTL